MALAQAEPRTPGGESVPWTWSGGDDARSSGERTFGGRKYEKIPKKLRPSMSYNCGHKWDYNG